MFDFPLALTKIFTSILMILEGSGFITFKSILISEYLILDHFHHLPKNEEFHRFSRQLNAIHQQRFL
uniref:Transmembrane protein n=1 Tax=Pithovirus LCPAC404 TaxID=2506597 RepID=A0A481ZHD0_9VIRU|nr:MAG: hypothetical protein LCPAC404_03450 [Pithovirus LCPAC404]